MKLQNYYNSINNISNEFILPFDIDDASGTEYEVEDEHSNNQCFDIDLNANYKNLKENEKQILGNIFTTEQCNIMRLMKLVEEMRCPDDAIEEKLTR